MSAVGANRNTEITVNESNDRTIIGAVMSTSASRFHVTLRIFALTVFALSAKYACAELPVNNIGIYFDETALTTCLDSVPTYPRFVTAHLILRNPACGESIGGWEARLAWDANLSVSLAGIRGQSALQIENFPNFRVGYGVPLLADTLVVLADLSVLAFGPGGIYIEPAIQPMISGAESPILVFGEDTGMFALMSHAYGDSGTISAAIGNLTCPEANDYAEVAPDTGGLELSDQLIVVTRPNAVQLPDADGTFGYSRAAFSSPTLKSLFASRSAIRAGRVFLRNSERDLKDKSGAAISLIGGNDALVIDVGSHDQIDEVSQLLRQMPEVLSVEPNARVEVLADKVAGDPDDPGFGDQWGLKEGFGLNAVDAWSHTTGASNVTIGILDNGIRSGHEEFLGRLSGDTPYFEDHGARVAGIAAAAVNNGVGIAGVSPNVRVNSQVIGSSIATMADAIADGIVAAVDVMNHSYRILTSSGNNTYSPLIHRLFMDAYKAGIVHTVASGNYYLDGNPYIYPARNGWAWDGYAQGMVVVGGIDELGAMYTKSTSGPHVDLVAPAVGIVSTTNGAALLGDGKDGTSFGAPHAAGVAALLLSVEPSLDPDDIDQILKISAVDMFAPGRDDRSGWGSLSAEAAMDSLTMNDLDHVSINTTGLPATTIEWRHGYPLEGFPGHDPTPVDFWLQRVQVNVVFPTAYRDPPHVWGRGNGSTGLPEHSWYNIPYTNVVAGSITTTGCTLETYVYRLDIDCPWAPPPNCPPEFYLPSSYGPPFYELRFAYTVLGKLAAPGTTNVTNIGAKPSSRVSVVGPNPFNARVELEVQFDEQATAQLQIYDIGGTLLRTFAAESFAGGVRRVVWDGCDDHGRALPSGVYFAVLKNGRASDSEKLVMVK